MKVFKLLVKFLLPQRQPLLGRWQLKHNHEKCENYILNYYGDPGYPNNFKNFWINKKSNQN